ncbi:ribonuclease H-like domain-containing protein [Circinella umbellata]|nr:ribonuclease H-like domain-containing protein [Circinella umbellata]
MTRKHQETCVGLLDIIPTPILVYYAMEVFKLQDLIGHDGDFKEYGVKMSELLIRDGHYNEAISCIRKLCLYSAFPIKNFAAKMFAAGQGNILPVYTSGQLRLQTELLDFINIQLRYTFAGNLGVVPPEFLTTVHEDEMTTPPLPRLRERRFQKDLTTCAAKILQELNIEDSEYYFIWLAQRCACLRWITKARASQQVDENDMSIASSSNYNGLIELVAGEDPAIAKLAIKEFVDMNDPVAATYFSNVFGQQQFYYQYHNLPMKDRVVGMIKGETLSTRYVGNSPRNSPVGKQIYYQMPKHVQPIMVDSHHRVMQLKATLMQSYVCGLDTEWVPQFARSGTVKTALIQIASDQGVVYLVDIATALHPTNIALLQDIDLVLRMLFEESKIIKLAYDFHGDFTLLKECLPTASDWYTSNLVDMKSLRTKDDRPITGGLSGVISTFLGVSMNKKQQLSNWEQRPLTVDQATYAASDSYCLIEVYDTLVAQNHPFLKTVKQSPKKNHHHNNNKGATNSPFTTPTPLLPTKCSPVESDLVQF